MPDALQFKIHGMDCAEGVGILKCELVTLFVNWLVKPIVSRFASICQSMVSSHSGQCPMGAALGRRNHASVSPCPGYDSKRLADAEEDAADRFSGQAVELEAVVQP
jgi:hypothetical protein